MFPLRVLRVFHHDHFWQGGFEKLQSATNKKFRNPLVGRRLGPATQISKVGVSQLHCVSDVGLLACAGWGCGSTLHRFLCTDSEVRGKPMDCSHSARFQHRVVIIKRAKPYIAIPALKRPKSLSSIWSIPTLFRFLCVIFVAESRRSALFQP